MKQFKNEITLVRNSRGCYILDTVKGCPTCLKQYPDGCYGECYALKIARRYRIDFSKSTNRVFTFGTKQLFLFGFKDEHHLSLIVKQIKKATMPFIRIGEMGDPSEDWEHSIEVAKSVSVASKPIVIITKHWKVIPGHLLDVISKLNICVNTSISALDTQAEIKHRLFQFHRLKSVCNSVLRIVSCGFNKDNAKGLKLSDVQDRLFENNKTLNTVFRCSKENELVRLGIIMVEETKFLDHTAYASFYDNKTFFGYCDDCPDKCGVN